MHVFSWVSAVVISAACAHPAAACVAPPFMDDYGGFWSELPEQLDADEVVLEVQYLGVWNDPTEKARELLERGSACGSPVPHRYSVTRVLRGDFKKTEILLSSAFGHLGPTGKRYVVVGQVASNREDVPPHFRARVAPPAQRLKPPNYPWTVTELLGQLPNLTRPQ